GILKKLRPEACWEENFNIENIEGEHVLIGGKDYTQYRIYQAAFYPLNSKAILFPSVGLRMIKFKVAKNPSFFGQNRQEDFKTFFSAPKTVRVLELPPHPLRESVAVGNYRLEDHLQESTSETGKSTGFDFTVIGEGNISGIPNPTVIPDPSMEMFDPNIRQNITRQNGRVAGAKTFSYFIIPQEPGMYDLGKHLFLVYFNPSTRAYDTLRPRSVLNVSGESRSGVTTSGNDVNSFYDRIETADNELKAIHGSDNWQLAVNIFVLLSLGASLYLVFKK
ncbi:MAG: BatD family protein, partial [Bacteroidota bacterium]